MIGFFYDLIQICYLFLSSITIFYASVNLFYATFLPKNRFAASKVSGEKFLEKPEYR